MEEELNIIITELNRCVEAKEIELENCVNSNSYRDGYLRNSRRAIETLASFIPELTKTASEDPTQSRRIISDFRQSAANIRDDIAMINCNNGIAQ
jgi:hypothetical protein